MAAQGHTVPTHVHVFLLKMFSEGAGVAVSSRALEAGWHRYRSCLFLDLHEE